MTLNARMPLEHVVLAEFENGEGILVDLRTKKYYTLNETALLIWKGLEQNQNLNDIAGVVVASYDVTLAHACRSIDDLIQNLGEYKLISN